MRSFTSSSEARFLAALVVTFFVLLAGWERLLRGRASATVDFAIDRPAIAADASRGEEWVIFGNCLMMTGVSPKLLSTELADSRDRTIVNIATHEQSPLAYFDYLRRTEHYPDVIIANVSSWLNGTNFEQEGVLVMQADPLGLRPRDVPGSSVAAAGAGEIASNEQAYRQASAPDGQVQKKVEGTLSRWASQRVLALGRRYHLFDYALFLGTLGSSGNLDNALYQLNMQSWFRVTGSETDGLGFLGLHVEYRDDWNTGLERMAERSLQRLRLTRLLTERYWSLLDEHVRHFQQHGSKVVLVRMPEHPKIREFNDSTYQVPEQLRGIEGRTGSSVLDISRLGVSEGVHLFDAVHPDAQAAQRITREIASGLRSRGLTVVGSAKEHRPGGG